MSRRRRTRSRCSLNFDLTGATVSAGFVHKALARCAAVLASVIQAIKALITVAAVVHFDETTLRAGKAGVQQYVWSASTALRTFFALGRRCECREVLPRKSSRVLVFVEDAAEAVAATDASLGELVEVGDRFGQWCQRSGVRDPAVGPMPVEMSLVLTQEGRPGGGGPFGSAARNARSAGANRTLAPPSCRSRTVN